MPLFTVSEAPDPFLSVHLEAGERIVAAPESVVTLSEGVRLQRASSEKGLRVLARAIFHGSLPQHQTIESPHASGDVLLAPVFPGAIEILRTGEVQFRFPCHSFLAASSEVCLKKAEQKSLNHGEGPILETSGTGTLVLAGFGSLHRLQLKDETPILVNSRQLVAWDSRLVCERPSSARHLLFGRGKHQKCLLRIRGTGSLYLCSRRSDVLFRSLLRYLPPGMRGAGVPGR